MCKFENGPHQRLWTSPKARGKKSRSAKSQDLQKKGLPRLDPKKSTFPNQTSQPPVKLLLGCPWPNSSRASTTAPASSSANTAAAWPLNAAAWSAVRPRESRELELGGRPFGCRERSFQDVHCLWWTAKDQMQKWISDWNYVLNISETMLKIVSLVWNFGCTLCNLKAWWTYIQDWNVGWHCSNLYTWKYLIATCQKSTWKNSLTFW